LTHSHFDHCGSVAVLKKSINKRYGERWSFCIYPGSKEIPPYDKRFKADLSRCDENLIVREPKGMI